MKLLLLLLLCPFFAFAQINKSFIAKSDLHYAYLNYAGNDMFGFQDGKNFGYMDVNEKVVIPATLPLNDNGNSIPNFVNGLAIIRKADSYGVINKQGQLVIPYEYESLFIADKTQNIIRATKLIDNKKMSGIINGQNKIIVPLKFESINIYDGVFVVVQNKKLGLWDISGKELLPAEFSSIYPFANYKIARATKDSKSGFIDFKGNWLFEKPSAVFSLYDCAEGLIKCKVNNKYGYLDLKGNEVIITKFEEAGNFSKDGIARIAKSNADIKYKTLYGYINKKGDEVIPVRYESLTEFNNGLATAKDSETNRYGFIDKTGKWVIQPTYLNVPLPFDNYGGCWVRMTDNKYHYIDKAGKDYGSLDDKGTDYKNFKDPYIVSANTDYPYALISGNGKIIKLLDDCDGIYTFANDLAGYKSKKSGLYGFLNLSGDITIPADFTGFSGFTEDLARVTKTINNKTRHGYINKKGETVIPFDFDFATSFENGWAVVKKDTQYYFMNTSGKLEKPSRQYNTLTEFNFGFSLGTINNADGLNNYYYIDKNLNDAFTITARSAYSFFEEVAIINRDKTYEIINKKGESVKMLTDIDFLKFTNEGKLAVRSKSKWGYIDTKGNQVIPFIYDSCDSYKNGYAKVMNNKNWGIIDKAGKVIIEPAYGNILPGDNDLFIFYDNGWGILDKTKKIIAKPSNFLSLTPIYKNIALAKLNKSYAIFKSPLMK